MVTAFDVAVPSAGPHGFGPAHVATELRDSLLPDLLAVSILVRTLRSRLTPDALDEGTGALLESASSALETDVSQVRSLIDVLVQAA